MHFDETFIVFVALIGFFAILLYYRIPSVLYAYLDVRANQIREEIAEAKRLREEAEHLFNETQKQLKKAEQESLKIIDSAERQAELIYAEAQKQEKNFIASRLLMLEKKIYQAEMEAMSAIYSAVSEATINVSKQIITDKLDDNIKSQLFNNAVKEIKNIKI
ncbi:ATP synthase protein, subunit B [Liberibacter crescens BT-1]|uniref:ATP synthase subunit b n=1 Tax=Liberibacter crescens (strain BT-1) TaxID=1215343 RepID=L0ET63_LIBCB|nr:ATP synthase subunit B [Liberibacter crescens]AGA64724.1 ATP synthase protein, subunit B [Liberibacter crescens BT-1]AMC12811.1 hypothetical protein RL73_03740 [Liberibacter crescens]